MIYIYVWPLLLNVAKAVWVDNNFIITESHLKHNNAHGGLHLVTFTVIGVSAAIIIFGSIFKLYNSQKK